MKLLEKILVPTDFGKGADQAVKSTISVAKTFNSEIILLHVIPEVSGFSLALEMVKRKVSEQLQDLQTEIERSGIRVAETAILSGVPFDHIVRKADQHDVNVIIMGAGEKNDDNPFRLGITAEKVLRKSSKPVWVVKPDTAEKINNILCPVDCSEPSARALTNAIFLARSFQAKLTVLRVVRPLTLILRLTEADGMDEAIYVKERYAQFEMFLKNFDFHNVSWGQEIRHGEPHQEILTVAGETKPDLLVMGSVGRSGLSRILMGSVATKVVRQMPCSVITVKSEHAIRLRLTAEIVDIRDYLKQGKELLEKGFASEALEQFEQCISRDILYAPAWEGLSAAYKRLGREATSEECREAAEQIRQELWAKKVEAEARSRHHLTDKEK